MVGAIFGVARCLNVDTFVLYCVTGQLRLYVWPKDAESVNDKARTGRTNPGTHTYHSEETIDDESLQRQAVKRYHDFANGGARDEDARIQKVERSMRVKPMERNLLDDSE
ncbi:hypothetical protein EYZ11_004113 [Aspergillus tanneri]|uniref:Uncharacterized protein n=1 Tax=Aspergillus tanneri TaxID=1220188 RepID=A0A4S3JLG3_9EURO|nr:hypothetical protein EYZ11_004113 [Aspergillus tanneri]